jgi:hypothetical protein
MVLGNHPIYDTPVSVPALEILRLITCEAHHISSSHDIWVPMLDDTVFPFRVTWILFIMLIASLSVNSEQFTIEGLSYNPVLRRASGFPGKSRIHTSQFFRIIHSPCRISKVTDRKFLLYSKI